MVDIALTALFLYTDSIISFKPQQSAPTQQMRAFLSSMRHVIRLGQTYPWKVPDICTIPFWDFVLVLHLISVITRIRLSSIMQSQRGGTSGDPPSAPQPPPPLVHFNGTADGSKMDSRMVVGLAGIGFMCRRVKVIGRLKLQWQRTDSLQIGLIPSSLTEDTAKPQYLHW
ncbi:hypothetical protein J3A83DRAFT_3194198 [Scleroderma citrinum]